MSTTCAICGSDQCEPLFDRANTPLIQNAVYADRATARTAARGDLDFWRCAACGFVWNAAFVVGRLAYGPDYENRQSLSPAFLAHLSARADACLNLTPTDRPATIVEVGCGQGDFLNVLSEAASGRRTLSLWGFDPAWRASEGQTPGGAHIAQTYFDEETQLDGRRPDVVVSRHVIEHIPDPLAFLSQLRKCLTPAGRLAIETPDVDWILRTGAFHDFFYEHCSLFNLSSLDRALARSGFQTMRMEKVFGEQYLWAEAIPVAEVSAGHDFDAYYRRWNAAILAALARGPVLIWGAGAKGANFVQLFDPDGARIAAVIDVNPAKQNRYLGGGGHRVISPDDAANLQPKTIFVMNPAYRAEIGGFVRERGWSVDIVLVE